MSFIEYPTLLTHSKEKPYNGTFFLIFINILVFFLDYVVNLELSFLYLHHHNSSWWQFLTAMFCHVDWIHLSGNLFFLYIFGKLVEEDQKTFGMLIIYIVCGLGANLLSIFLNYPNVYISIGASGAISGLFTACILGRFKWREWKWHNLVTQKWRIFTKNWRNILEVLILGQFVVIKLANDVSAIMGKASSTINWNGIDHVAHIGGAIIGLLLLGLIKLGVFNLQNLKRRMKQVLQSAVHKID